MLPRPTAVLLDWDGFIVNSLAQVHRAHNIILTEMGKPEVDFPTTVRMTGHGPLGTQAVLGFAAPETAHFQRRMHDVFFVFTPEFELMPGAAALIAAIPANVPIGVVSNKEGRMLRQEIAHLGWQARIGTVVAVNEAPANKPSPIAALQALHALGVVPNKNVWFGGDTGSDVACANAADLTSILVSEHEYHGPAPDFRYPDLHALIREIA